MQHASTTISPQEELDSLREPSTDHEPTPEIDAQLPAIVDPVSFARILEAQKAEALMLTPTDPLTVKRCAALIETCKVASSYAETRRTEIVKPLNTLVDEANAIWQPIVKGFAEIAKGKSAEVSQWITEERRKDEARQRKELEDARLAKEALERKAEAERREAERIRLEAERVVREEEERKQQAERDRIALEENKKAAAQALLDAKSAAEKKKQQAAYDRQVQLEQEQAARDEEARLASLAEQQRLEKEAAKLDAKAEQHDVASTYVTPEVLPQQAKTIDLGGSKLVTKAPKKTWLLTGWDKQKPLKVTDPKLSALVGDIETLPPGVRFLLKHADLSPVHLNKSFGVIQFPAPFAEVDDYSGAALRKAKG